ncbi:MAG: PIG-L family deacetylase [Candidatus Zixiibacteriota bacterium]
MDNKEAKTLDVLAIAAHRDDIEITSGGTMIKLADMGYKTGILDLTQGEMGSKGTAEERERDSVRAAEILGLSWRGNLRLPDAAVEVTY